MDSGGVLGSHIGAFNFCTGVMTSTAKATRFFDDVVEDARLGRRMMGGGNDSAELDPGSLDGVEVSSAPDDVEGRSAPRRRVGGDGLGGGEGNQREHDKSLFSAALMSARACTRSRGAGAGSGRLNVQSPHPPCGIPGSGQAGGDAIGGGVRLGSERAAGGSLRG